jgi:phosphonopyruvate decarboxylase
MILTKNFIKELKKNKLHFATGVPDSLLKDLCFDFESIYKSDHITAANEGSAIATAIGYYLKNSKIPIVYLQNSGLGNAINPLVSLADKNVYSIPIFLIIGWRGELGKKIKDEPQHISQGKITTKFLNNLKIKYKILSKKSNFPKIIKDLRKHSEKNKSPVCLLVRKNSFETKSRVKKVSNNLVLREKYLEFLINKLPKRSNLITTTGILSREVYDILKKNKKKMNHFMCVGGMGHASSIAAGIAHGSKKKIYCLDGDGSIAMHMGALSVSSKKKNIVHLVFNNYSHESVGGHDTSTKHVNFSKLAKVLGYKFSVRCSKFQDLDKYINILKNKKDSTFIEILCGKGHRKNVSRPKESLLLLKNRFRYKA